MAIPTMISTLILAPKVRAVARDYFRRLDAGSFDKPDLTDSQLTADRLTQK
jgi:hypothetical protein